MNVAAGPPLSFRAGSVDDAAAIADLIASFQRELTDDPSGLGAEPYLASVSAPAEQAYLASPRYRFLLAWSGPRLAGFIAIRDRSHVFHLFVAREFHRRGLARRLWELALQQLAAPNAQGHFTVNASLAAVPAYAALGFTAAGPAQHAHGISFVPMQRTDQLG